MTNAGHGAFRLAGRQVVVVGLGASGLAAARVLRDLGAAVRVTEARSLEDVAEAAAEAASAGAEVLAGGHVPEHLDGADLVVTSPGVPQGAEVLRWAMDRRLPVWSELEVGARLASAPYIGITGTNGKSTTTEMTAAILRASGFDAVACGNVGHPFSLAAAEQHEALVVEASSFQLRFHETFRPRVSVLLNLAQDHLDWHGTFEAYREAKARVFVLQGHGDLHLGNRDDPLAAALSGRAPCPVTWFTLGEPGDGEAGYLDGELVLRLGAERRLGRPAATAAATLADSVAAAAAAVSFGADPQAAGEALSGFAELPHRGQVVAEADGITFVDDSKATNPHAALASLAGRRHVVLLAGGRSKGVDLSPLATAVPSLAAVVAIGEAAHDLSAVFEGLVPVRTAGTIEEAVEEAYRMAPPGGTVLLAPACASQDMFQDYRERGDRFAAAARRVAAPGSAGHRRRAARA